MGDLLDRMVQEGISEKRWRLKRSLNEVGSEPCKFSRDKAVQANGTVSAKPRNKSISTAIHNEQ